MRALCLYGQVSFIRVHLTVSVKVIAAAPLKASTTCTDNENLSYRDGMNAARKLLILKALSRTQGNRAAAAKLLGLESKYLLKLMKSLEIE